LYWATLQANIADVIVVIEGTEVLLGCKNLTNACLLLMGFIYALNLSYPPKLRNTFEVFQKIFLGLDALKFSPKVSSLHRKQKQSFISMLYVRSVKHLA